MTRRMQIVAAGTIDFDRRTNLLSREINDMVCRIGKGALVGASASVKTFPP
jgi:hypothetical protein